MQLSSCKFTVLEIDVGQMLVIRALKCATTGTPVVVNNALQDCTCLLFQHGKFCWFLLVVNITICKY